MTSKPKQQPSERTAERFQPPPRKVLGHPDGKFPVFSSRADMQNPIYLYLPGHLAALVRHLGNPATTVVLGEVPVGLERQASARSPDPGSDCSVQCGSGQSYRGQRLFHRRARQAA